MSEPEPETVPIRSRRPRRPLSGGPWIGPLDRSLDELVLLSEEEAVQARFDAANAVRLHWLARVAVIGQTVAAIPLLVDHHWRGLVLSLVNALAAGALLVWMRRPSFARYFRRLLIPIFLAQYLLFALYAPVSGESLRVAAFVFSAAAIGLRLRTEQYLVVFGGIWASLLAVTVAGPLLAGTAVEIEDFLPHTIVLCFCLGVAILGTRRARRRFVAEWQVERERHGDRLRMREELEAARRIQLGMLPSGASPAAWLDVASFSLPATEVGGDYYDYFRLSETQVAVVVGDVAGHGVASGILLSGVRSCLHLLHEYRAPVGEIMERLNRIVRQTTDRRMFMTLLYALIDRETRSLTLSAAGHPPLVHYSARQGTAVEVGLQALPLGTPLDSRFEVIHFDWAEGDVFVFDTDGLAETVDASGADYGHRRLTERMAAIGGEGSAKQIRDALLLDLWSFKGDAEQVDDVTLVVVKPVATG